MLKIVYIITTVDGYGADKSILNNIIFLKKNKLLAPFVVIPRPGRIELQLTENNIPYTVCDHKSWFTGHKWLISKSVKRSVKSGYNKVKAYYLSRELAKHGPFDFIHTNTMTTSFGIHLAKYLNANHIMHIRELPIEQFGWDYEYGESHTLNFIGRNSCTVIANSKYVAHKFKAFLDNIVVLHNGIFDTNLSLNPNKYSFNCGLHMISAGRLEDDKGQMVAIEAMEILKQMGYSSTIHLDIYGDGGLKQKITDFVRKKQLKSLVKIKPFDPTLIEKLKDYHIGLICSRCEAFGRTTIEFMGNGLTVIGNDTGNTPLLIKDGETGLIVKSHNPDDLAQKIISLIVNPSLIHEYGQKAFESVRNGFSIGDSSHQLMTIYRSIS